MKRKFGFNLPPLVRPETDWFGLTIQKIPSRADNDSLKRSLDKRTNQIVSPRSPLIDRPVIDPAVIKELRTVCTAVVRAAGNSGKKSTGEAALQQTLIPQSRSRGASHKSDTDVVRPKVEPTLPAKKSSRPKEMDDKKSVKSSKSVKEKGWKSSGDSVSSPVVAAPEPVPEVPAPQAPVFPKRSDSLSSRNFVPVHHGYAQSLDLPLPTIHDRPQTAPSESRNSSYGTPPMSSSTDMRLFSAETGVTSVAITPSTKPPMFPASDVASQSPLGRANNRTLEWMKSQQKADETEELEATEPAPKAEPEPALSAEQKPEPAQEQDSDDEREEEADRIASVHIETSRPLVGRSGGSIRNITNGLKNFVQSRSRSRSRSRDPSRAPSAAGQYASPGWRGWGMRRQRSASDLSDFRSDISVSQIVTTTITSKPEVDSNKKLPPLPSLDTYKEPELEDLPVPPPATHLASLAAPRSRTSSFTSRPSTDTAHVPPLFHKSKSSTQQQPPSPAPRKASLAPSAPESKASMDSTRGPSVDVLKAAAKARSMESLRQQSNLAAQQRKNSIPHSQYPRKGSVGSATPSRPSSRGGSRTPTAKYSIMPVPMPAPHHHHHHGRHQRTPSQPIVSHAGASAAASLPQRPATRDATSARPGPLGASSLAHVTSASQLQDEEDAAEAAAAMASVRPPTVNFSRKLTGGEAEGDAGTVTALPPMPPKQRAGGLRRMLSSLSVKRTKSVRGFEKVDGWVVVWEGAVEVGL
jgi:hypothetical protein